jgi:hypothetical protein
MTTEKTPESEVKYVNGFRLGCAKIESCIKSVYSAAVGDRGFKGVVMPAVVGAVVGVGSIGLLTGLSIMNYQDSFINENGVVEKEVEDVVYTELKQGNGRTSHFMRDGRVGKTLESMEEESKAKAGEAYDIMKAELGSKIDSETFEINTLYDGVRDNAVSEARDAWGISNPLEEVAEESKTNYHDNIGKLDGKLDKIISEGRK